MAKDISTELDKDHFRVVIFGSARIKEQSHHYAEIYNLAKMIAEEDMDVVTGGGPGLMDAATTGHYAGKGENDSHGIGLQIKLPREQVDSRHLDIKAEFTRFSGRLDTFMVLANVVVVAPGGVGTLLELAYTWQLMQVKHTCKLPIILLGEMWPDLLKWVKKWPLKHKLLDKADLDLLYLAKDEKQAMKIIRAAKKEYDRSGKQACSNLRKYKLE